MSKARIWNLDVSEDEDACRITVDDRHVTLEYASFPRWSRWRCTLAEFAGGESAGGEVRQKIVNYVPPEIAGEVETEIHSRASQRPDGVPRPWWKFWT